MNEYEMALGVSALVFITCIASYLLCWAVQWSWSWVDDSEISSENWLAAKCKWAEWKYPVYNAYGQGLEEAVKNNKEPFGYAKDKKHKNKGVGELVHGTDYVYSRSFKLDSHLPVMMLFLSMLPILLVIAFNFYPLTLSIISTAMIAYLARFARRSKKLFDKHVTDKDVHKE